jgi:hypothetical protein
MGRILVVFFFLLLLLPLQLYCQEPSVEDAEPEEYQDEEFSPFLRNLRRAEIIMLGSFPITLFLSMEVFDIYRYIDHIGDPEQYRYQPWPFRSPYPVPYGKYETLGIFVSAISASLLIALADYIIGRGKEERP